MTYIKIHTLLCKIMHSWLSNLCLSFTLVQLIAHLIDLIVYAFLHRCLVKRRTVSCACTFYAPMCTIHAPLFLWNLRLTAFTFFIKLYQTAKDVLHYTYPFQLVCNWLIYSGSFSSLYFTLLWRSIYMDFPYQIAKYFLSTKTLQLYQTLYFTLLWHPVHLHTRSVLPSIPWFASGLPLLSNKLLLFQTNVQGFSTKFSRIQ